MNNIIVLGAGMVGSAMAIDLSKKHNVTLTDLNKDTLNRVKQKCAKIEAKELDVTNISNLKETIKLGKTLNSIKEDKPGLWDNIRAKKASGKPMAKKGSKAYKSAKKAGDKINKEDK